MKLSSLDKYKIGGLLIVTLVVLSPAIVGYIINLKITKRVVFSTMLKKKKLNNSNDRLRAF